MFRQITIEKVLFLLVLLWATIFTFFNTIPSFADDPGLGWHLQTGDWIRDHIRIPYFDPFLSQQRPWVSDQWFSDVIFSSLYSLAGWQLLYGVVFFLYLAAFFLILFPRIVSGSESYLAACLALILSYRLGLIHLLIRPTLLGFFCFVCLYGILCDRRGDSAPVAFRQLLPVPILFFLWANLHPSFVLGLVLLGIWCCEQYTRGERGVQSITLLFLLSSAMTFVNPYTWHLHESIYALAANSYFMQLHHEWHQLSWLSAEGRTVLIFIVLQSLALLLSKRYRNSLDLFSLGSLVVFLVLGMNKVRILPYFAIVACLPTARAIVALAHLPFFRKFPAIERILQLFDVPIRPRGLSLLSRVIAVVLMLSVLSFVERYGPSRDIYPFAIASYMNENTKKPSVIYASPHLGGFITRYIDGAKAVIDDRNTLLGEQYYKDFLDSYSVGERMLSSLKTYGVTHLILPREKVEQLSLLSSGRLMLLYREDRFDLFEVTNEKVSE